MDKTKSKRIKTQANHTADDGLKLLDHLGISITDKEKSIFKEKWEELIIISGNLIETTAELYSKTIPFALQAKDPEVMRIHVDRNEDFFKRLEKTQIEEQLKQGLPLTKILQNSSKTR
jgi:hypothetical protein